MHYTYNEVENIPESGESWWEYIFLKPIINRLVWLFANYTNFTPNQITIIAFIFGLLSAYSFLNGKWYYLIIGSLLFEFSFILDYVDGKIARLKGMKSVFGAYLDISCDVVKYFFIILGIVYGQYILTKDISFFLYGYIYMFTELAFLANTYIIRFNQPEFGMNRDDVYKIRHTTLNDKMPFIMKLKTKLDPDNRLTFIPVSADEAETIIFLIGPIMMQIKLGMVIASIILFVNILCLAIFNFSMKKR